MEFLKKLDFLQSQKKALIAFNVQNIYHLNILSKVSSDLKAPVIAQLSSKYVSVFEEMFGLDLLVNKYQNEYLTFHLDHCMDMNVIKRCIDAGFASVMYDGSSLPLEENIKNTNLIYAEACARGAALEAELGAIHGIEDGFGSESGDLFSDNELVVFAKEAKYDMLALAIGNAHGHYTTTTDIKVELLNHACDLVGKQLFVLHGGTGMPVGMVKEAINYGVVKINVSTALKTRTIETLREYSHNNSEYNESKFYDHLNNSLGEFYKEYIINYTV